MPEPITGTASDHIFYAAARWLCVYIYIPPNLVTLSTVALAHSISLLLLRGWPTAALLPLVFLRVFLDLLDGTMARHYKETSPFGRALDMFCDSYYLLVVWLTFCWLFHAAGWTAARAALLLVIAKLGVDNARDDIRVVFWNMDIVAKYKKDAVLMFVHENLVLTHILVFGLACSLR